MSLISKKPHWLFEITFVESCEKVKWTWWQTADLLCISLLCKLLSAVDWKYDALKDNLAFPQTVVGSPSVSRSLIHHFAHLWQQKKDKLRPKNTPLSVLEVFFFLWLSHFVLGFSLFWTTRWINELKSSLSSSSHHSFRKLWIREDAVDVSHLLHWEDEVAGRIVHSLTVYLGAHLRGRTWMFSSSSG